MAHFARINSDNIVERVHVVDNKDLLNEQGVEKETVGIAHLTKVHGAGHTWIQTSYNGNFRKNYAGKGFTYDAAKDAFISPKPFPSWTLNEDTCQWDAPVTYPDDGKRYSWNEGTTSWDEVSE